MNRRSFLRGLLTVTAASIAPLGALDERLPAIIGDGVHDDTAGILAAVNGRPFVADGLVVRNQTDILFGTGRFRMTAPLLVDSPRVSVAGADNFGTVIIVDHGDAWGGFGPNARYCSLSGFRAVTPEQAARDFPAEIEL